MKTAVDGKLFGRAKEAVDTTNMKVGELQTEVNRLLDEWDRIENGSGGGSGNTGNNTTGGGTTEPEEPIVNRSYLRVGEYVEYTPDTAEAYVLKETETGISNTTIAQDKNLKWRILNINEDGTVDIISEQATSGTLNFKRSNRL